jgi:DNA-binding NtrC family response regulator
MEKIYFAPPAGSPTSPAVPTQPIENARVFRAAQALARALLNQGRETNETSGRRAMCAKSNVLIVDDDEVVRLSHLRSLKSVSCAAEAVDGGEDALRLMETQKFDVVLLDLRMPGLDGMTVLRTIKQKWPESEVVVITGFPTLETAKEAVRLGASDYLAKPVGPVEVINATGAAITRKKWALHRMPETEEIRVGASAGF